MGQRQHSEVFDYRTIRRLIGLLAVLLPCSLVAIALLMGFAIMPSISEFFYTPAREVLVGTIGAISIFLFCYNGHPRDEQRAKTNWRERWVTDRVLSLAAALGALGVAFFPVKSQFATGMSPDPMFVQLLGEWGASTLHKASALTFFAALTWFCLDNFRRTPDAAISTARMRANRVYKACGYIILFCTLGLVVLGIAASRFETLAEEADRKFVILILEAVALIAFSAAWIVKGKTKAWFRGEL